MSSHKSSTRVTRMHDRPQTTLSSRQLATNSDLFSGKTLHTLDPPAKASLGKTRDSFLGKASHEARNKYEVVAAEHKPHKFAETLNPRSRRMPETCSATVLSTGKKPCSK